ncbi:MAG: TadE family type IV pilus minor pilin [Arcanobacterium sp.]|nr:TadE family type IV pilus minor pilin [Arcanobacterium sp.]
MVSVEWALTIPIFIGVVLMCAGALVYTNSLAITTSAAREAARAYAIEREESAAKSVAYKLAGQAASVNIVEEGEYVRVTVRRQPVRALAFLGFTAESSQIALIEPGSEP